jgi:hypothetical protein
MQHAMRLLHLLCVPCNTVSSCWQLRVQHMLGVQLAVEVGLHADSLMNSLRVAALQGELTAHSLASSAAHGTFNERVEDILEEISEVEDVPVDKLRGWLHRQTTVCPSPRAKTPGLRMTPSPTFTTPFSPRAKSGSPDVGRRMSFASIRRAPSAMDRVTPSPTASGGIVHFGPVLPSGTDEVIRAFGTQKLESGNSINKSGSGTWGRNSKTQRDNVCNSLDRHKSYGEGRWVGGGTGKGSASDARW